MGNCLNGSAVVPSSPPPPPPPPLPAHLPETVQCTHPTSIPLPNVPYPPSPMASSSQSSRKKPTHSTAPRDDDAMTSTPSPGPGAVRRARVQSQDTAPSCHHRCLDGRGYPSPSSGGDVFTSQLPDFQEMYSHQHPHPPGGTGPMQRTRSVSMGVTSARSHSSGRRTWAASISSHDNEYQRVGTQFMSGLPSATIRMLAGRQEGRPRLPFSLHSLLSNNVRFRIIVVGKRGSGKSSLIKDTFKVDLSGSPINICGRTAEFCPRDNGHVIVHECSAFGPREMQIIRDFITAHNHESRPVSERLHAIWICVPISDVINGQLDGDVTMLLGTGVPLVIVFTKFDLIVPNVSSRGYEDESATATTYEGHCRSLFGNVPTNIVSTQPKLRHLINKLVATTDGAIIAHSRSRDISAPPETQRTQPRLSPEKLAWSVSQRASRDINIQATIDVGRKRYWRRLWSSDDFRGETLANCIEVIHADIVGTWNLPDTDKYLSSMAFKSEISYLVQDLSGSPISTSSRSNGTQGMGAPWLNSRYTNSKENICVVAGYIVDLTLILCSVFGFPGNVLCSEVHSVIDNFTSSSLKTSIHVEICSFFCRTVRQFEYHGNDVVMTKICDLILMNCNEPFSNAHV